MKQIIRNCIKVENTKPKYSKQFKTLEGTGNIDLRMSQKKS